MSTVFDRHPKLTLSVFLLLLLLFLAGVAEVALRFIVPYDIGYYTAVRKEGVYVYPYGTITMNSDGYPDEEFNRNSSKKRIGYFGDSVIFGTGAGEGYRLSDLLQDRYSGYEHWTFGMISNGIQNDRLLTAVRIYDLDTVIYAFNLNDILPTVSPKAEMETGKTPLLPRIREWVYRHPDRLLHGKSYLYTAARTGVKNALTRMGYGHTGFRAAELFPEANRSLIGEVAGRVNTLARELDAEGITFCILILPYEMQISKNAADTYHGLGIRWEEGFTDGSTQKILREYLEPPHIYDGRQAFDTVRDTAKTGEYFVYDKGDKIDFNHPNRAGHALLAEGFARSGTCPGF